MRSGGRERRKEGNLDRLSSFPSPPPSLDPGHPCTCPACFRVTRGSELMWLIWLPVLSGHLGSSCTTVAGPLSLFMHVHVVSF